MDHLQDGLWDKSGDTGCSCFFAYEIMHLISFDLSGTALLEEQLLQQALSIPIQFTVH